MIMKALFVAIAACFAAVSAQAKDPGDVSVGLGVTSFGYGLHGEYALQPNASVRALIMGGINISDEFDYEETTVDGRAELGGFATLLDYYPLSNAWRLSGGLFISNSEIAGTFDDGDLIYDGELTFKNEIAPMLTSGFKYPLGSNWAFSGDVGVVVSALEVTTDSMDPDVQDSIADLNADLADIPVFPFIGFAVSYSY